MGLKLETFTENIESCLKTFQGLKLTFLVAYQALSPFHFQKFLEYVLDLRKRYPDSEIKVGISHLRYPDFLSLDALDKKFLPLLKENLQFMKERNYRKDYPIGFSSFEIQKLERIVQQFEVSQESSPGVREDFTSFIAEYEKRKNVSFREVFQDSPLALTLV